ncbi:unnamed protein product [Prorocentrum cordatum]|uniref:Uncharacterized protein n=1 Tax=Prorocentrum cordatum TaxID=2364126 RepID=A0ABN9VV88_9DINO|nr:unnamed protein product [Polarella glacialis]
MRPRFTLERSHGQPLERVRGNALTAESPPSARAHASQCPAQAAQRPQPPPSACNWTCTCPTTTGAHAAEERTSEEEEEEEEESTKRRIGKSRWQIHNGARKRQTWSRARGAGACQERPARAQCASSSSWTAPTDTS